jgi:alcohol dehydrogenase class IV
MADKFNLIRTPKLVFGSGKAGEIPDLIKNRGRNILVLTGSESLKTNPEIVKALAVFEDSKFESRFEKVGREPSPSDVDGIVKKYLSDGIDVVIAVGGGSVLDAGKAVSAMLSVNGNVKEYLEGVGVKIHPGSKKFFVAVPGTAGTGSEATSNAVISVTGPEGFKKSLRHENFVPDLAIIDPLLALDCPADITANTGMDAFTQLVESYLSVNSNRFTDNLALDGISRIKYYLERAVQNGHDVEARSGMAYAAFLSGITLANAGLGLVHGFASAIGGYFKVPHGLICGTLMGVVNRYNVNSLLSQEQNTEAHEKYAVLGRLLSGRSDCKNIWFMNYAVDYIDRLTDILKIRKLGEFGIAENDLPKIISASDHKANPVKFNTEQLKDILRARL